MTPNPPAPVPAASLLRSRKLWITPAVLAGTLIVLISVIYIGSIVNPTAHLHGLPVVVVDQDQGQTLGSRQVDIGRQVVSELDAAPGVTSRLELTSTTLTAAEHRMDTGKAFAAIVVPPGFTASLLALYGQSTGTSTATVPHIEILTNQRAGGVGTSLATGVAEPAIAQVTKAIATKLGGVAGAAPAASAADAALRADPVAVTTVAYHPLPDHSALGLSAFYVALLTLMCGFLGATITNSGIDSNAGYAPTEVGPKWRLRRPLALDRWNTLLTKWTVAAVLAPVLVGLMLIVAVGVLGMYAPNVAVLWLFCSFAAIVVALGTLVLFAAFGSLGQLLAMLVFLYLSLASSGGTIPLQALPGFFRVMANVEPLRQILGGVRSIMYYDMTADAGLVRGLVMTGIGLVFWLAAGAGVTAYYDRRGLRRLDPELLAYVGQAADEYRSQHH